MNTSDFDFILPEHQIATSPAEPRDSSRLLCYRRKTRKISHHHFFELPQLLEGNELLVFNRSKVIPARLLGEDPEKRPFEIFLLSADGSGRWSCLVKPGKRVKSELRIRLKHGHEATVRREGDSFFAEFSTGAGNFFEWLETVGETPLPPYLKRVATPQDRERYQTVYAESPGSIAAPTAGLHFTPDTLKNLGDKGVESAFITLHVGYGTFAPIPDGDISTHKMHRESYEVPPAVERQLEEAKRLDRPIIPVGTTALRSIESIPKYGLSGATDLFITPGYPFQWTDGLITNFHLPKSTLFILVASLIGLEEVKRCYEEAISREYRFYSYGDAMVIL